MKKPKRRTRWSWLRARNTGERGRVERNRKKEKGEPNQFCLSDGVGGGCQIAGGWRGVVGGGVIICRFVCNVR